MRSGDVGQPKFLVPVVDDMAARVMADALLMSIRGRSLSSSPTEAFAFPSHQVLLKRLSVR